VRREPVFSGSRAQWLIRARCVTQGGYADTGPAGRVGPAASIELPGPAHYVSGWGLKLENAPDISGLDPRGLVVADVAASSGGFADRLLQRCPARVCH